MFNSLPSSRCPRWRRVVEDKLSDEPETEFCPSVPLFPNLWFRSFSFSRAADAVHRYCRVVQAIFARPPTTPPISLVTHLHREIDQNPPSVFPGGHPGNLAYPVLHRKRAIPSSAGRRPLLRFSQRGDGATTRRRRRRKGRKRKGREGKESGGREGKRKRREEKKDGKENKTSGGGEWTRGWVGGADGNGQQHSRGSPRGKFIP